MMVEDLLYSLLHKTSKDDITIRLRSRYDICLIVYSMAHDVLVDVGSPCEKDLASGWIAF
jgi:hypothetical protein